jgi:hypothetical protein
MVDCAPATGWKPRCFPTHSPDSQRKITCCLAARKSTNRRGKPSVANLEAGSRHSDMGRIFLISSAMSQAKTVTRFRTGIPRCRRFALFSWDSHISQIQRKLYFRCQALHPDIGSPRRAPATTRSTDRTDKAQRATSATISYPSGDSTLFTRMT